MRGPTRRKFYGKVNIAQELASSILKLSEAAKMVNAPGPESPWIAPIEAVAKELQRAVDDAKLYRFDRKRVVASLERERKHIEELLAEVKAVPITQDEKAIAKLDRKKKQVAKKEAEKRVPKTTTKRASTSSPKAGAARKASKPTKAASRATPPTACVSKASRPKK